MEFSSEFVGLRSRSLEVDVTWEQIMGYAASVGDGNEFYLDDMRPGGILAPPMLSVALTWPISDGLSDYWSGKAPWEVRQRQVHYSESLRWHRPIVPGDHLRISGELVGLLPHRAGSHMIVHYMATDSDGLPVFEEYSGAILRRVRCKGEGRVSRPLPVARSCPEWTEPVWEERLHIDPCAAHVYAACSNITFAIHTSQRFARKQGLPGVILHGVATLSMATRELVNREGGGDPTSLRSLDALFTGIVVPGTDITVRVLAREQRFNETGVFFDVLNQEGKKALSEGYAVFVK